MMENQQNFESSENLFISEFTQAEIEQLIRLRAFHVEKAQKQLLEERHRLEFARWLVVNGRLTDELPIRPYQGFHPRHLSPRTGKAGLTGGDGKR